MHSGMSIILVLLGVATTAMLIAATASNFWLKGDIVTSQLGEVQYWIGLWNACASYAGIASCASLNTDSIDWWQHICRAFMVIATCEVGIGVLLAILEHVGQTSKKRSFATFIVGAILTAIAVAIFAANSDNINHVGYATLHYAWSFIVACVSIPLAIVCGVLALTTTTATSGYQKL